MAGTLRASNTLNAGFAWPAKAVFPDLEENDSDPSRRIEVPEEKLEFIYPTEAQRDEMLDALESRSEALIELID